MAINTPSAAQQLGPLWAQELELKRRRGELEARGYGAIAKIVKEVVMAYVTKGSSLGFGKGATGATRARGIAGAIGRVSGDGGGMAEGIGGLMDAMQQRKTLGEFTVDDAALRTAGITPRTPDSTSLVDLHDAGVPVSQLFQTASLYRQQKASELNAGFLHLLVTPTDDAQTKSAAPITDDELRLTTPIYSLGGQ